ncbi:hypothetical protein GCM10011391_17150 [Pullulanibacillus camelliae]|uniref:Uncharacterized protein n=1 Tax=Pullulanibacillus camelliae TaxID=1707096 RepID=A0A8J2VQM8_9BACL|nr:hypothetical protein GCM10011391_17150 [Pullulanibacillus camelliae]
MDDALYEGQGPGMHFSRFFLVRKDKIIVWALLIFALGCSLPVGL